MSESNVSLKEGIELFASGAYDYKIDKLSPKKRRAARRTKRRYQRAERQGRLDAFYDDLVAHCQDDDACCAAAPAMMSTTFTEDTPLGFDPDSFFDFLDGILERMPAILDAVLKIISLFVILIALMFFTASESYAQCPGGRCPVRVQMRVAPVQQTIGRAIVAPVQSVRSAVVQRPVFRQRTVVRRRLFSGGLLRAIFSR